MMAQTSNPKCLIIACGALAREIVTLQKQFGLEAIKLKCLPAEYHNTPEKIAPGIEKILSECAADYETILVAYGDCGTGGGLDRVLEKYNATRLPGAHCYEFFAGNHLFEELMEKDLGSFFLTDYLVKNFDRLIISGLGLDRFPHLRDAYFQHYTKLVYLSQIKDADLIRRAEIAAERLGLEFVTIHTAYGGLEDGILNKFTRDHGVDRKASHVSS